MIISCALLANALSASICHKNRWSFTVLMILWLYENIKYHLKIFQGCSWTPFSHHSFFPPGANNVAALAFPVSASPPWCSFVLRSPLTALQMAFFWDKLPMTLMCCLSRLSLWSLCNLVMLFEVFVSLQVFRPVNITSCDILLSCRDHINSLTNTRSRLCFNKNISGTFRKAFLLHFYQC